MNKKRKYMFTAMTSVILLIVAIIILNVFFSVLKNKVSLKIDLTPHNFLSLSDKTQEIIDSLDKNVEIISFVPLDDNNREMIQLDEFLKQYDIKSDKISYKRVDSESNPGLMKKYQKDGKPLENDYNIVFDVKDRMYTVIDVDDLFKFYPFKGQNEQFSIGFRGEQYFTSALVKVTRGSDITAIVSTGHGECFDSEDFKQYILPGAGYNFKNVNLATEEIPEEADMIIIASPEYDYSDEEIDKIDRFLKSGGDIQIMMDPDTPELAGLNAYMNEWGASLESGLVVEEDTDKYWGNGIQILGQIPNNDINETIGVYDGRNVFYWSRPVLIEDVEGITATPLAVTGKNAYVTNNYDSNNIGFVSGDVRTQSNLAVMFEKVLDIGKTSKMYVMGTSLFLGNYETEGNFYTILENSSNRKFYSGIMAYMSDQPNDFSILGKNINPNMVIIDQFSIYLYTIITVVIIPLVIIACGLMIWIKRRHS